MVNAVITATGSYLPEKILTNHDIAEIVDTSDEWITTRTGIKQRHVAADSELTSDMAAKAAEATLEKSGISAEKIDLIIVATTTPDNTFPATAARVQALINASNAAAFDMQAVCAGFIYALVTANNFIKAGAHKNILVIGADMLTKIVDWEDRTTCILFGDGAGAVLVQASDDSGKGILGTNISSDGKTRDLLYVDGGVSLNGKAGHIKMSGQEVFKHAAVKMAESTQQSLGQASLDINEVDWIIPHQANARILTATARKLGVPKEKLIATIDKHANTSAASIPLALDDAIIRGKIKSGDLLAMQAIGGGLAWGSCVIRW